jgi:uncharacterized SAM-binding protein YcdF (DUF218 family)
MHQFASVLLAYVLSPFNLIILLILVGFLKRKTRAGKKYLVSALVIFLVFSNSWLLNWYALKWQPSPGVISTKIIYSCGIVPGGFASPDANGNGYFNATADRFIEAEKLFKVGEITHILISGGNGKTDKKSFREGNWVKNELIIMGIPDSVIFVEDRSNNTSDNAHFAREILDSLQLRPPYLLITSAIHVPRATLLFRDAGVSVIPFPCSYFDGRGAFDFSSLWPNPSVLSSWNFYLKEAAGYMWYRIKSK